MFDRPRSLVIIAIGVLVSVGPWLLWNPTTQPYGSEQDGAELAPDAGVPIAAAPIEPVAAEPRAREPEPAPAAEIEPEQPEQPEAPPMQIPPHPRSQQYAALLAQRFDVDSYDPDRALDAAITAKVRARLPAGSHLDSVECRHMLCRVHSFHNSMADYDSFVASTFTNADPDERVWLGQVWIAVPSEDPNTPRGRAVDSSIYLERSAAERQPQYADPASAQEQLP